MKMSEEDSEHLVTINIGSQHQVNLNSSEARKFVIEKWMDKDFASGRVIAIDGELVEGGNWPHGKGWDAVVIGLRRRDYCNALFPIGSLDNVSRVMFLPLLLGGTMSPTKILIIGAGGIGSLLADLVTRALAFSNLKPERFQGKGPGVVITLMDQDVVEEHNLPHQRFASKDMGAKKVDSVCRQLKSTGVSRKSGVALEPKAENFSSTTDISGYDLVVVAVDRDEPRKLVHTKAKQWLDLRARGDGFVMFSHVDGAEIAEKLPSNPKEDAASCQLEGAIDSGNIQFGFALAATHGAQWIVQWIRKSPTPQGRMYTIHMGELQFPTKNNEVEV